SRIVMVVEDAADAARLLTMGQVEVLVAPALVAAVIDPRPPFAGLAHGGVEGDAVRIRLGTAAIEHRREVAASAEPPFRGDDHARVHVRRRYVGVPGMSDQ